MSDTLSVSSSTADDDDDRAPTDDQSTEASVSAGQDSMPVSGQESAQAARPAGFWTASGKHNDTPPPTSPSRSPVNENAPETVAIPTDPYARPVHIPTGRTLATWMRRTVAYGIDGAVFCFVLIYCEFLLHTLTSGLVAYEITALVFGIYNMVLIAGHRGQTAGMRAVKIAVRDIDTGESVGYRNSFRRFLVMWGCSIFYLFFVAECLVPLWDKRHQALHDRFARTVVVDVGTLPMAAATHGATAHATDQGETARTSSPGTGRQSETSNPVARPWNATLRFVATRSKRFWSIAAAVVVIAIVAITIVDTTARVVSDAHSPDVSAIAYLKARADRNVTEMFANAGVATPPPAAGNVAVLLTRHDIQRELAGAANALPTATHVKVEKIRLSATGNAATVTLDYVAGVTDEQSTFTLVRSDLNASGWEVRITPARLDVDVPTGTTQVTIAGIPVAVEGQVAHAYLFPSVVEVAAPATAIFEASRATVDTTHQAPDSDPQEVPFAAQLLSSASTSAQAAVATQVNACLAATTLTPANCPNNDIPATTSQGDTYTNIAWTGLGDPTAGLTVTLDASGTVAVAGSMTDEVTYSDTTSGASFFGSVSNVQTDGPFNVSFSYPLTWNGTGWSLGTVTAKDSGSTAST